MALTRGEFLSYDFDRMIIRFTMMDGDTAIICAVSTAAMDELEGTTGVKQGQREAQFIRMRDLVEECAARKYLDVGREGNPPGLILRGIDFRVGRVTLPATAG